MMEEMMTGEIPMGSMIKKGPHRGNNVDMSRDEIMDYRKSTGN